MREGLVELIRHVEMIPGVRSARILYLYPSTTSFELIDALADSPVFQTYYDMPIQHIDDGVLRIMKRGFGEEKTRALLERMRQKEGRFVRTSVIAGHPGESEEAFDRLCDFLESFGFDRINVFAYSNEEGTSAYAMEQLSPEQIEERTQILGEIARRSKEKSLEAMVGRNVELALDGPSQEHESLLSARPLLWAPEIDGEVLVNDSNDLPVTIGGLYEAKITEMVGEQLLARLLTSI